METKPSVKHYLFLLKSIPGLEDYLDRSLLFSSADVLFSEKELVFTVEADRVETKKLLPGKNYLLETDIGGVCEKKYYRLQQFILEPLELDKVNVSLGVVPLEV